MNVEYTGRQYEITPAIRKEVESGLAKLRKILRDKFETKVILAVEKHRHKAEITITPRNGPIVGLAQASDMKLAVNQALGRLEKQALKYKTRIISKKRKSHNKWNGDGKPEPAEPQTAVGLTEKTAVPVVVHKYPDSLNCADGRNLITDFATAEGCALGAADRILGASFAAEPRDRIREFGL